MQLMQQNATAARQPVINKEATGQGSPQSNDIFKWFSPSALAANSNMATLPIPKHVPILTLDDIEH